MVNSEAFWRGIGLIISVAALVILLLLSGCAYQTSRWTEEDGVLSYHQTNITPPFGRQAESAGQMSATVLDDGTWELTIGRIEKGVDNTAQAEIAGKTMDLLLMFGKLYGTGGITP